jgi:polyphosphate kinase
VTIDNLYAASHAGVQIDLIVRGTCCLVPGVPGLSEHIRVRSTVGRYLEHARFFYFENHGGESQVFAGSADWMPRNFFRRVEVLFPLETPDLRRRVLDELFAVEFQDNENARELHANGAYLPLPRINGEPSFCAQDYFMASAATRAHSPE